ncbi:MAG: 23S rRNA (uracil(1939)-C(5))-methyltransferase RlmD [Clostridiaceae bacterium]|nr:23S rRNA (uracil(1939)-C(5))-methyltransferase RlmD [Clostridiaceae bacterium]
MIKKDNIIELDITGMTHEGMGVGKIEGFAVFVQGAIEGEKVRAKIIKVLKNYAIARVMEYISSSPFRTEPFCPAYKRCGGCSLQHMTYEKTLDFKRQVVTDNLIRIGGLSDVKVNETIGMENPLNYRNKAQYPVGIGKEGPIAGFFARRSHEIIDAASCDIQHSLSDKAKDIVLGFVKALNIPVYNENTGEGIIRHVVTKIAFGTGEVMVIIVATRPEIPKVNKLVYRLKRDIPGLGSIILNVNPKPGNVVLGTQNITLYGKDTIEDKLDGLTFEISPLSFYQVNSIQTEVLYKKALEFASLSGNETVYDLYCGIGTITLFAARKARLAIGIEVVTEAVEAARRNAIKNNIVNTEFHTGEAEKVFPKLFANGKKADVVFVDPPRKGCDEVLLKTLAEMSPSRIVYVSCNPSTLARDLKYLCGTDAGYEVKEVQPVDMFPWTMHVECIVGIRRTDS